MESFPPYNQIDHPAMPKSRLNSLLIILMATLFASGTALIVLKQIDTYHRQQLYIAEQAALPVHKATQVNPATNSEVKTFSSPELGFTQEYQGFYEMSEIKADEAFPVMNYEKGPDGYKKGYRFASSLSSVFCPVMEVLVYSSDEKTAASWLTVNSDIKQAFAQQSTQTINGVQFIKLMAPAGDTVPSQVYLALKNSNIYQLNYNLGLKDDSVDPRCGEILSGFKLTSVSAAALKTYKNEEYGFSFEYPESWGEMMTDSRSALGNNEGTCKGNGKIVYGSFEAYETAHVNWGFETADYKECMGRGGSTLDYLSFKISKNNITLYPWVENNNLNTTVPLVTTATASQGKYIFYIYKDNFTEGGGGSYVGTGNPLRPNLGAFVVRSSYTDEEGLKKFKDILSTFKFTK